MRISGSLVYAVASVSAWSCDKIDLGHHTYDLSALDSEHVIETTRKTPPSVTHITYTINPCAALKHDKAIAEKDQCPSDTQVCKITAIEKDDETTIIEVLPFASRIADEKSPNITQLTNTELYPEGGLTVTYPGPQAQDKSQETRTIIDFACDESVSIGTPTKLSSEHDQLVHLTWKTKHACISDKEKTRKPEHDVPGASKSSSWGFFTWVFLIVFMAIASFLIFTLFLNYNRYGQVGLDLVPAMDSFKDIPYLFKDFASQVVETVKGTSGRTGYSAV